MALKDQLYSLFTTVLYDSLFENSILIGLKVWIKAFNA